MTAKLLYLYPFSRQFAEDTMTLCQVSYRRSHMKLLVEVLGRQKQETLENAQGKCSQFIHWFQLGFQSNTKRWSIIHQKKINLSRWYAHVSSLLAIDKKVHPLSGKNVCSCIQTDPTIRTILTPSISTWYNNLGGVE